MDIDDPAFIADDLARLDAAHARFVGRLPDWALSVSADAPSWLRGNASTPSFSGTQ